MIFITSIILLVGCSDSAEPTEAVEEPTPVPTTVPVQSGALEGDVVKVGVLSVRSAVATNAQYGPIISYLQEETNRPFELIPLTQASQLIEVENGNVDFILSNPLASTQMRRLYDTQILATLERNVGTQFSGLIIARNDGSITSIDDMRGKKGVCVNFTTGAGACLFQTLYLKERGFDPTVDFSDFTENNSQDNMVLGVLNGTYDVAFIRTGQLERMVRDGSLISIDEVFIVDQANDDFAFPHTTELYPEWAFSALQATDSELVQSVKDDLIAMPADYPGLADGNIQGFAASEDYAVFDELIETLQLLSWDVD